MNSIKRNIALTTGIVLLNTTNAFAVNRLSDEWKEAMISTRFELNDILDDYDIDPVVKDGTVMLSGKVSSEIEKELAGEIAKNVEGVSAVENQIVVSDQLTAKSTTSSIGTKIVDASTTARVKSRYLWSSGVPATAVSVDTNNGIVTLSGAVDEPSQKQLAEKLAINTNGVRKVDNRLTVKNEKPSKIGSVDLKKVEKNAGQALESAGETMSDTWIDTKVYGSLGFARSLNIEGLKVSSKDGVVSIGGVVFSDTEKELAAEIAKDIKGVKSVDNQIKVVK